MELNEKWSSLLDYANNEDYLIEFIFKHKREYYISKWHKGKWAYPVKIKLLNN